MPFKQNNPGCCSCGPCGCPEFPAAFFTGDGLGTHTLNYQGDPNIGWRALASSANNETWQFNTLGVCVNQTLATLDITYTLRYVCPDLPGEPGYWRFAIGWKAILCRDAGVLKQWPRSLFQNGTPFGIFADIPFTCDVSSLSFSLPTTFVVGSDTVDVNFPLGTNDAYTLAP